jgi:hypothetical protein
MLCVPCSKDVQSTLLRSNGSNRRRIRLIEEVLKMPLNTFLNKFLRDDDENIVIFLPLSVQYLVEKVPDLVCVPGMEDVPERPRQLTLLPHTPLHDQVTPSLVHLC